MKLGRLPDSSWPINVSFTVFHHFPSSSGLLKRKIFMIWANEYEEVDQN